MTKASKKNPEIEGAEYGIDSRYTSDSEKKADGTALMEARLQRMKEVSDDQIIAAKLIQVKLKMEEYIQNPAHASQPNFTNFLISYIDTLYNRRSDFADDIDITPIRLSQVLNNHRDPNEEFIKRLMVHSDQIFKNLGRFDSKIWYEVYYQEKISNAVYNQEKWRSRVEKHVKVGKRIKV